MKTKLILPLAKLILAGAAVTLAACSGQAYAPARGPVDSFPYHAFGHNHCGPSHCGPSHCAH